MNRDATWRDPNGEEIIQLIEYLTDEYGLSESEAYRSLKWSYIQVLEEYRPESPGWGGKVLIVIFGYINAYELIRFKDDGELELVRPEFSYGVD